MANTQEKAQKEFRTFFQGASCMEWMQKMMSNKEGCCGFNCTEMMEKMLALCSNKKAQKEEATKGHQE